MRLFPRTGCDDELTVGCVLQGFPGGSEGKESAGHVGHLGFIPGSGRSPGEGKGNPLQYSCLENPMDRGTRWATVHGVAESQTGSRDDNNIIVVTKIHPVLNSLHCPEYLQQ